MSVPDFLNTLVDDVPAGPQRFTPTGEQAAIIDAALRGDNVMIKAYAGCSKTTTLRMIAEALPKTGIALAFNVDIKKELEKVFPPGWDVLTLNGLGHRAWARTIGKRLTVDTSKVFRLTKGAVPQTTKRGVFDSVLGLVEKAQVMGLGIEDERCKPILEDTQESWEDLADAFWLPVDRERVDYARKVLRMVVREAYQGTISFSDQLYMPTLFGGVFPQYGVTMGDEVQDWSIINQRMVQRTARGQLILVGDPLQAIYQFRGADGEAMENARSMKPQWTDLTLTQTFRCPKVVVARQQHHAPGFTTSAANAEGVVLGWDVWDKAALQRLPKPTFIICRNNAPLFSMAFKLLRAHVPVKVLGADIGKGLKNLAKKILPDESMSGENAKFLVEVWRDNEEAKAEREGKEGKVPGIHDRAESLIVLLDNCPTVGHLAAKLTELFADKSGRDVVTLSTGHRIKGKEAPSVVHLDPWRIPSQWAKDDPRQLAAEANILYVIETRAKHTLVMASVEGWKG